LLAHSLLDHGWRIRGFCDSGDNDAG